ncbi:MAG TPA: hypothetical protein VMF12_13905 [Xanthobacteraceae bacterium]|nr:hypothetical protein [Xanthobacteraceae bacterium]
MPITDIVIVCVITFAFVIFAAALAWGDHQTREIARASRQRTLSTANVGSLNRSAQAESAEPKAGARTKAPAQV